MTEPVSSAQYFPWDGGAIFVGTAGVIPAHAHQAIQICFLFEGRIRLRRSNEDPWLDYDLGIGQLMVDALPNATAVSTYGAATTV